MYDFIVGLFQFGVLVAFLIILYFIAQMAMVWYEEAKANNIRALGETIRAENERLLQQIEARRVSQPVDYPLGAGPHDLTPRS